MEIKEPEKSFEEQMRNAPPPEWLVKMQEHYFKTGTFRPEDLYRLLGDPKRGVEVGPQPSLSTFLGNG